MMMMMAKALMMMSIGHLLQLSRKNHQQPESYRSSPQKHQAYHGYTGKAMIRPGFNKSIADSAMQRHRK